MPAPSPSITPSVGAKLGKSVNALPNCRSSRPPASAISAEISVSAMAATDPNTSVSTIMATATPISSPTGAVVCSAWSTIAPLRDTSRPASLADLGDLLEPLARLLAERRRGVVVLDRHVRDAPVLRQLAAAALERTGGARHVWL